MLEDINNIENVRIREKIINLRIFEVLDPDNNVKRRGADCSTLIGMQISLALYNKIRKIATTANTKFAKEIPEKGISFDTFFDKWRKGSKKIRDIMWKSQNPYVPHNTVKFAENTNTVITAVCSEKLNSQWACNFLQPPPRAPARDPSPAAATTTIDPVSYLHSVAMPKNPVTP
jgi:hypothetical protein